MAYMYAKCKCKSEFIDSLLRQLSTRKTLGVTDGQMAKAVKVNPRQLSEICSKKSSVQQYCTEYTLFNSFDTINKA